ncbi:Fe-S cluster assembly transcriptional regulator IscR, partial [Burkholderia multivorans]
DRRAPEPVAAPAEPVRTMPLGPNSVFNIASS